MDQKSPSTLSHFEQLPPELLAAVFEQIRLDTILAGLPQSTTPYSRTLLPFVRRNLYRNITIKTNSKLRALVANHQHEEIPSLIRSLTIKCACKCGSAEHVESQPGTNFESIDEDDLFAFFVQTTDIKELQIRGPTQLSNLLLSREYTDCCLASLESLTLTVAIDSTKSLARQFKWIGGYAFCDLDLDLVEEEDVVAVGASIMEVFEELVEEAFEQRTLDDETEEGSVEEVVEEAVEEVFGGTVEEVAVERDEWTLEDGIEALASRGRGTARNAEVGSSVPSTAEEEESEEEDKEGDSDWEDTDSGPSSGGDSDEDAYHNHISFLSLSANLSNPQLVEFIQIFRSLAIVSFFDTGDPHPNLLPLLEAIPADDLVSLELNTDFDSPRLSVPIDNVVLRFQNLDRFCINSSDCTTALLNNLATLPSLHRLSLGPSCSFSFASLEAIIRPGPGKMLNLGHLDLDFFFVRGTSLEEADYEPYVNDEGDYCPYPNWCPPDFSDEFSREHAERLIAMLEEEDIMLEGNLREAIDVYDDFFDQLIECEQLQAEVEAELEEEYGGGDWGYDTDGSR